MSTKKTFKNMKFFVFLRIAKRIVLHGYSGSEGIGHFVKNEKLLLLRVNNKRGLIKSYMLSKLNKLRLSSSIVNC